ncbi:hypothetical protein [Actinomadura sp. NTSP31]|uniref:hypothetical protein n=1 Tax=Actinomadura sp. NTSP31 TaxID=1735447 RepID=UPI0035C260CF
MTGLVSRAVRGARVHDRLLGHAGSSGPLVDDELPSATDSDVEYPESVPEDPFLEHIHRLALPDDPDLNGEKMIPIRAVVTILQERWEAALGQRATLSPRSAVRSLDELLAPTGSRSGPSSPDRAKGRSPVWEPAFDLGGAEGI